MKWKESVRDETGTLPYSCLPEVTAVLRWPGAGSRTWRTRKAREENLLSHLLLHSWRQSCREENLANLVKLHLSQIRTTHCPGAFNVHRLRALAHYAWPGKRTAVGVVHSAHPVITCLRAKSELFYTGLDYPITPENTRTFLRCSWKHPLNKTHSVMGHQW